MNSENVAIRASLFVCLYFSYLGFWNFVAFKKCWNAHCSSVLFTGLETLLILAFCISTVWNKCYRSWSVCDY